MIKSYSLSMGGGKNGWGLKAENRSLVQIG